MPQLIDLTGKRFGRWQVIEKSPEKHDSSAYWLCKCDCGTIRSVNGQQLKSGRSKSCGCYRNEILANTFRTHGKTKTRLYAVWASMRERCYCETCDAYQYYGAKRISICDEWMDFERFESWAFSSGYNPNAESHQCTIDRIDNSKGYSPDNCRWVNSVTQSNNQTKNRMVTYNGKTKTVAEWGRENGWNYMVLYDRLFKYHWDVERAMTQPVKKRGIRHCKSSE